MMSLNFLRTNLAVLHMSSCDHRLPWDPVLRSPEAYWLSVDSSEHLFELQDSHFILNTIHYVHTTTLLRCSLTL